MLFIFCVKERRKEEAERNIQFSLRQEKQCCVSVDYRYNTLYPYCKIKSEVSREDLFMVALFVLH